MRILVSTLTTLMLVSTGTAVAQQQAAPIPLTHDAALALMEDHALYRVQLVPSEMPEEQQRQLASMIGEAVQGQHFFGAIYGFRPEAGGTTEYSMRSGLHSREAARDGALADCEAAREAADSECTLVGDILPEGWTESTPTLSHLAVQALQETADDLPGSVVVTRSRTGDAFEVLAGDDVRENALEACNARNREVGLPEDCEVVIDDGVGA